MNNKAITVTILNSYITSIFNAEEMLINIDVIGEITSLSIIKGVAYFSLKDENSIISCVCFSGFDFKNGDKIIATGSCKFYAKGGRLNFNVSRAKTAGIGELFAKFIKLQQTLKEQGYFDNKKPFPKSIKKIGVVTSKEGAVFSDILNVRARRNPYVDVVLYPVRVQGVLAEKEICNGINFFNNFEVDLVIIARGGGSFEDLAPFNSEAVANSVKNCNKFTVSAVGHETDFSICDMCSDLRAPTPSAASELVCKDVVMQKRMFLSNLSNCTKNISALLDNKTKQNVALISHLHKDVEGQIEKQKMQIKNFCIQCFSSAKSLIEKIENKNNVLFEKINKLNPQNVLKLGYASISKNKNTITSIKDVNVCDKIDIILQDGKITAKIESVQGE